MAQLTVESVEPGIVARVLKIGPKDGKLYRLFTESLNGRHQVLDTGE